MIAVGLVFCLSTLGIVFELPVRENPAPSHASLSTFLAEKKVLGLPLCPREGMRHIQHAKERGSVRNIHGKFLPREGGSEYGKGGIGKVFVSLSVCWSSNTRLHNKGAFPYRLATRYKNGINMCYIVVI